MSVLAPATGRIYLGMTAFCAATSIPMSFFFFVLPAVLRQAGHSAEIVGSVAVVYLPYAVRFLWAPLVDRIGAGRASSYRAIALVMVGLSIVALVGFLPIDPKRDIGAVLIIAALVFAFLATGMTALDGYVVVALGAEGRKRVTIFQACGFTLGGILVGIGAIASEGADWAVTVALIAGATGVLAVPMLLLPTADATAPAHAPVASRSELWRFLASSPARRRATFSLVAHGGVGLPAGYLPVLQVDSGLSAAQVGLFSAVGSNVCGLLAAVAAGALLVRWGGWRALAVICATGGCVLAAAAALHAALQGPAFAVTLSLAVMGFGYCYVVPYRALVLSASSGRLGATQAALLSSLDVVVGIVAASVSGVVVTAIGFGGMLVVAALACISGTILAVRAVAVSDEAPAIHRPSEAT